MIEKFTRQCPSCAEPIHYKHKKDRNYANNKKVICRSCSIIERAKSGNYNPKERFICINCGKNFFKWRKQMGNPETPFCSKKCHYKTLVGQKFGRLLCVERIRDQEKQTTYYKCICDCGKETINTHSHLKNGAESCGCKQKEDLIKRSKKETGYAVLTQILNSYRQNAKVANREFLLSREEFEGLILSTCKYCGDPQSMTTSGKNVELKHNGIDRIDSNQGYALNNCVPCCKTCNQAKSDRSLEEFYDWINKISSRINNWGQSHITSKQLPELVYVAPLKKMSRENPSRRKPEQSLKKSLMWYYKRNAKYREIDFLLTEEKFYNLIFSPCYYCKEKDSMIISTVYGASYKHNGVDRLDSSRAYIIDNCVPCCKWCNRAKNTKSLDEFKEWAKRLIINN